MTLQALGGKIKSLAKGLGGIMPLNPLTLLHSIGIAMIVASVAFAGGVVIGHIKGNAACEIKNAEVRSTAAGAAQLAITKVGEKYAPELKSLQEAPDNNGIVGPLTTRALDGLR